MRPGDIVLCHDGGGNRQETVQALGTVLPILLTVASPSSRSEGRQVPNGPGTASGTPRGAGGEEEHSLRDLRTWPGRPQPADAGGTR